MTTKSKYTLTLTPQMERALEDMAEKQGLTKAQVIRRAVGLMKYLQEERGQGNSVRLRGEDGTEKEIVFESDVS